MYLLKATIIIAAASICVKANADVQSPTGGKAGEHTVLRIVEVFNTSQRLWLYQQNYTNEIHVPNYLMINTTPKEECTFFKRCNITQDDYYFWRKSNIGDQWFRIPLHGRFFQDGEGGLGSMNVSDLSETDPTPFEVMKLMYADINCSVFFVTQVEEDAQTGCELYVRNKAVSHGLPQNCSEYYNKNCNTSFRVYNSGCQNATITS